MCGYRQRETLLASPVLELVSDLILCHSYHGHKLLGNEGKWDSHSRKASRWGFLPPFGWQPCMLHSSRQALPSPTAQTPCEAQLADHIRHVPPFSKTFASKTFASKTFASKTLASRTLACKTLASTTLASTTLASKTFASKTLASKTFDNPVVYALHMLEVPPRYWPVLNSSVVTIAWQILFAYLQYCWNLEFAKFWIRHSVTL